MTEVAIPTCWVVRPKPPLKWKKPLRQSSGARGVGKKTKVMALKALVCIARREWVRIVRTTFLVRSCFQGDFLRVTGSGSGCLVVVALAVTTLSSSSRKTDLSSSSSRRYLYPWLRLNLLAIALPIVRPRSG